MPPQVILRENRGGPPQVILRTQRAMIPSAEEEAIIPDTGLRIPFINKYPTKEEIEKSKKEEMERPYRGVPTAEEEAPIPKTGPFEALTYGVVGAPAGIAGAAASTGFGVLQELGTEEVRRQLPEGEAYDWLALIIGMGGSLLAAKAPSLLLRRSGAGILKKTGELAGRDIKDVFARNRELKTKSQDVPGEAPVEYQGEIRKPVEPGTIEQPLTVPPRPEGVSEAEWRIILGEEYYPVKYTIDDLKFWQSEIINLFKAKGVDSTNILDAAKKIPTIHDRTEFFKNKIIEYRDKGGAIQDAVTRKPVVTEQAKISPKIEEVIPTPKVEMKPYQKIIVQRIEEKGVLPNTSPDKPHGLYTTPADIISPHEDLGGIKTTYEVTAKKPLLVSDELTEGVIAAGRPGLYPGHAVPASGGIKALKKILPDKFESLMKLNKKDAVNLLSKKYPDVNWNQYHDSYEMMEALAGIEARKKGFDVIIDIDAQKPEFSEYIILDKQIMKEVPPNKRFHGFRADIEGGQPARRSTSYALRKSMAEPETPVGGIVKPYKIIEKTIEVKNPLNVKGVQGDLLDQWAKEGDKEAAKLLSIADNIGHPPSGWYRQVDNYIAKKADNLGYDSIHYDAGIRSEIAVINKGVSGGIIKKGEAGAKGKISAGGLSYGQDLPKYAYPTGINLEKIDAGYDVKKFILDQASQNESTMISAKQGKISLGETKQRADELLRLIGEGGDSEDFITKLSGKTKDLDSWITAGRDILNTSAQRLRLLQEAAAKDGSDEALAKFRLALETHTQIQAEVGGASSKIGRALSAHRLMSTPTRNWKAILNTLGGRELTEDILDRLSKFDPQDTISVNKFIREVAQVKTSDKVFEIWRNSILSGPQTQVANIVSNALTFLGKIPEETLSTTIESVRSPRHRERYFGEIPHHLFGAYSGLTEGLRKAIFAFKSETIPGLEAKLDINPGQSQAIKGITGRVIRIPQRLLLAADEFFVTINEQAELAALAYRDVTKKGLKGEDKVAKISEIISNPPKNILDEIQREGQYRTFKQELGPSGKTLLRFRRETPFVKYVIPFITTPINIAKFGLERTPLYIPKIIHNIKIGKIKGAQISDEVAKATMGTLIGAGTMLAKAQGLITGGGPVDKAERETLYRTGWQPYSIKVGDKYYSYSRLEPLSTIIGLTADAQEILDYSSREEKSTIVKAISGAIAKNLTSKTFLQGLSDAMNAWTDPVRYGETWINRYAGSSIPNVIAQGAKALDPELRETSTVLDTIRSRIPIVREGLTAKRTLWGDKISPREDESIIKRYISPMYVSKDKADKISEEMIRLNLFIGMPSKVIEIGGKTIDMTPEQYEEYVQEAGRPAKHLLSGLVTSKSYLSASDDVKAELIRETIMIYRDTARLVMKGKILNTQIRK